MAKCPMAFATVVSPAQLYREKTVVTSFAPQDSIPLGWTNFMQQLDLISKKRIGIREQSVGAFYSQKSDENFSNYFGVYNPARNAVESFVGVDQNNSAEPISSMDFIHDAARAESIYSGYGIKDRVRFSPEKMSYSYVFDYVQGFDSFSEGFSVRIKVPMVWVKTSLNPRSLITDARGMSLPGGGGYVTAQQYLAGAVSNDHSINKQASLNFLKITPDAHECKGIAGFDLGMRLRLWSNDASHIDCGVRAIFPYGPKPTGEFLFEPVIQTSTHHGLGFELGLDLLAFERDDLSVEFVLNADVNHLFMAHQIRVPLFKNAQGEVVPFGPYQLGGALGGTGMFPLANVLAQEVKVRPGTAVQISLSSIFSRQGLSLECGMNAKAKSAEEVEIIEWKDNTYGVVKWNYDASTPAARTDLWSTVRVDGAGQSVNAPTESRTINKEHLDLQSITTPGMMQGQIFGFVGYVHQTLKYPLTFGLGLMYEFPLGSNTLAPAWNGWCKLGCNF